MYNRMFMMVKEAALNLGLDLTLSSVLSDFEQALINALRLNFPTAEHRGCYYHYSQEICERSRHSDCNRSTGLRIEFLKALSSSMARSSTGGLRVG